MDIYKHEIQIPQYRYKLVLSQQELVELRAALYRATLTGKWADAYDADTMQMRKLYHEIMKAMDT